MAKPSSSGHGQYEMKDASQSIPSPRTSAHDQCNSLLLTRLSQEIRDMIYSELFLDTRFSHGLKSAAQEGKLIRTVPAHHSLSILRSCRRVKDEVGDTWLGKVLFHFEDTDTALDKLTSIPTAKLSQIRHLRLVEEPMDVRDRLQHKAIGAVHRYGLVHFLRFLPGLNLDVLTVLSNRLSTRSTITIRSLIKLGQGWKKLQFGVRCAWLSDYVFTLGGPRTSRRLRKREPFSWDQIIKERDGSINQPSVEVFRSGATEPNKLWTVLNSTARIRCEVHPSSPLQASDAHVRETDVQTLFTESDRAYLVVVQRGRGVNYQVDRAGRPGESWTEVMNSLPRRPIQHDPSRLQKVDDYTHADEYEWPGDCCFPSYERLLGLRSTARQTEAP